MGAGTVESVPVDVCVCVGGGGGIRMSELHMCMCTKAERVRAHGCARVHIRVSELHMVMNGKHTRRQHRVHGDSEKHAEKRKCDGSNQ
jgi:hypothetical protein